jgi:predicted nucleic acid-binding protein
MVKPRLPRIYLDANPLIDLAKHKLGVPMSKDSTEQQQREANCWMVAQCLQAALDGELEVFTSVITIAECTHVENEKRLEAAKPLFLGLLASGRPMKLVQPTLGIAEKARDLIWLGDFKPRGADALHVASALTMQCDELWTGDGKMLRAQGFLSSLHLRVCHARESQLLPAKYYQEQLAL